VSSSAKIIEPKTILFGQFSVKYSAMALNKPASTSEALRRDAAGTRTLFDFKDFVPVFESQEEAYKSLPPLVVEPKKAVPADPKLGRPHGAKPKKSTVITVEDDDVAPAASAESADKEPPIDLDSMPDAPAPA
jgi:hypothetical protein